MPPAESIGPVLVFVLLVLAVVLGFAYAVAPFMLYGIHARLGQLIDIQENISRQLADLRALQATAPPDAIDMPALDPRAASLPLADRGRIPTFRTLS